MKKSFIGDLKIENPMQLVMIWVPENPTRGFFTNSTQTRKKICIPETNPKMQKVCIFSLKSNRLKNQKPDPNPRISNPTKTDPNPTFGNPAHH